MAIRVYNTLRRSREEFVPRERGKVSVYVCGPTVYNYIHIGNARTFLNFDTIRRYLEFSGFEVDFIQNITDIDDKIIDRAREEGITAAEVAGKYLHAFEEDMAALGVRPPDKAPRATEHVEDMVGVIEGLIEKGYAYQSDGDVYFEVSKFPGYGKFSGRALEDQLAGEDSGEESERKRSPFDFALWKAAKPGEPSWESPWGPGRPGWHIECSTMSVGYLGEEFDIHGGGLDLVFPHHENEIAQAEAFSGRPFARYWLHSGMLNIDREKMSKSLGNIMSLREVLAAHDPDTVRMLMLGTHYRSPLNFGDDSLSEAGAALDRIRNCLFVAEDLLERSRRGDAGGRGDRQAGQAVREAAPAGGSPEERLQETVAECEEGFREAMDDDFNSAAALGALFGLVREMNAFVGAAGDAGAGTTLEFLEGAREKLLALCGVLGLFQGEPHGGTAAAAEGKIESGRGCEPSGDKLIELLLEVRQAARKGGAYDIADLIRDGLSELGVRVEDVKGGYRWRLERCKRPAAAAGKAVMGEHEQVEGRNPVLEALRGRRVVHRVLVAGGVNTSAVLKEIASAAGARRVPVLEVDKPELSAMAQTASPQGVIAEVSPFTYTTLEELLGSVKGESPPLVMVLDGVEDPQNLGSLLRIADACGVNGVVTGKRRSCPVTAAVCKASAGAVEHVPVVRVANLPTMLTRLKKEGLWVVGADSAGETPYHEVDMTVPLAVVLGGEGSGLGRLVRERCDIVAGLPMHGRVSSLNVSATGAVFMYEALRQRRRRNGTA